MLSSIFERKCFIFTAPCAIEFSELIQIARLQHVVVLLVGKTFAEVLRCEILANPFCACFRPRNCSEKRCDNRYISTQKGIFFYKGRICSRRVCLSTALEEDASCVPIFRIRTLNLARLILRKKQAALSNVATRTVHIGDVFRSCSFQEFMLEYTVNSWVDNVL